MLAHRANVSGRDLEKVFLPGKGASPFLYFITVFPLVEIILQQKMPFA
jgi:hypothetical protein